MHKLVILEVFDPWSKMPDRESKNVFEFERQSRAELRALLWLLYRPNDIVMLVDISEAYCKHCDQPIKEKAGWVVHRWVHEGGNYTCETDEPHTQAEPKEEPDEGTMA